MLRYIASLNDLEDPQTDLGFFLLNKILLGFRQLLETYRLPLYQHEWRQQEANRLIAGEFD